MSSSGTTSASRRFSAREIGGRATLDEAVERVDVLLAEAAAAVARQDAEEALRRLVAEERHHEAGADGRQPLGRDEVARERDLDRPCAPVVGEAHPRDVVGLGLGEADRRDDRRAVAAGDERDRAVGRRPLARELERPHHRLGVVLELERAERARLWNVVSASLSVCAKLASRSS